MIPSHGAAGFAALLLRGRGLGRPGNALLGIVGGVLGGLLFAWLDLASGGTTGRRLTAFAGAFLLMLVAGLVRCLLSIGR